MKQYEGELSFRENDIADSIDEVEGNRHWFDFNFLYYYRKPFVDTEGRFDLSLRLNDVDYIMFSLKEAQLTHLGQNWELSYGFQIVDWVEIDRVWGLGKINNRTNFDFFRPGQEGLPGVRYKRKLSSWFMFDIFASFLYIPELNPPLNIDADNGTITSKSPWAQVPATTANIEGVGVRQIFYDVNKPGAEDIIFQESYGINLRISPYEDVHFTGFYLRKPENSLTNTANVTLDPGDFSPIAKIEPEIFYHTLFGAQLAAIVFNDWKLYTSYYTSIPGDKPEDDPEIINNNIGIGISVEKFREEYVGAGFEYHVEETMFGFSFLSRISDFEKTSLLDKIPRWSQAINISGKWSFWEEFQAQFDFKYDTLTYDRLYMASIDWRPHRNWSIGTGFDIIGAPANGEGYWVVFRDNDSIFAHLKYLF
ncbi:MAG: hypothetical protein H6621_10505 [Halobacteriovoraceae bacterium]|nr:hypothetical protein [Halobacteriovoraceae bacterium]